MYRLHKSVEPLSSLFGGKHMFLMFSVLAIAGFFVVMLPTNTSAMSISWSSSSIDFGEKPGLTSSEYTATIVADVTNATYGFTSDITTNTSCLLHESKTTEECSTVDSKYKIPLINSISPEDSNNSTATLTLTSKATTSASNVAGEYSGAIVVTILAKEQQPNTGDWGFMQNFTATECGQMSNYAGNELMYTGAVGGSLTGKNTVKLTDSRNEQTYRIRKMQDGKCWMIDNLKIYNTTLYGADQGDKWDTDLASGTFVLPATLNTAGNNSNSSIRVDDPSLTVYCTSPTGGAYTTFLNTVTGCGYLYNWYTATAGKGAASLVSVIIADSICPKNWNLPTNGQFATLNSAVSLAAGGGQSFQAMYSGYLVAGGFVNQAVLGFYWSSVAHSSAASAYDLSFSSSTANASDSASKYGGLGVRCTL